MRVISRGIVAVMLLFAAAVASAPAAASAVPAWSVVPSDSLPGAPTGALVSVACATDTTCFAVGKSIGQALIEQWDGAHWSIVADAGAASGVQLNDIACAGATSCFAVGLSGYDVLVEQWDGSTWSVAPTPAVPESSALWGVGCATASNCVAVGRSAAQVLVEQWDGATWSVVPSPHPSKARSSFFVGVACPSTTNCSAVGSWYDGSTSRPLAERWNGVGWSIVAIPGPTATTQPTLVSVACQSSTSCFAVGGIEVFSAHSSTTKTLIEHWNGTKWSIAAGPSPAGVTDSSLADVTCPSSTSCFAVGGTSRSNFTTQNLVERWNGATWTVVASPNRDPNSNSLGGVACRSSASCFAVGNNGSLAAPTTVERWNGTSWSLASHPMPLPPNSSLSAVACAGTALCFAVGAHTTPAASTLALVVRRTESGWVISASPKVPGASSSELSSVSCPSATLCFAVGTSDSKSPNKTLIERWNGSTWSIVPSPNHGHDSSGLRSVSCASPQSCFAVGAYNAGSDQTLIERWNGSSWSIVASPNRAPSPHFLVRDNDLASVSCASAGSCFAVGSDTNVPPGSGLGAKISTLVERWNGSAWSIVASPNPGSAFNRFRGVSCASATNCAAVGDFRNDLFGVPQLSLIAHWNGTAWARVPSPDRAGARFSTLAGVSCPGPTTCLAVGGDDTASGALLAKRQTSTGWKTTTIPQPIDSAGGVLNAVACPSASTCYAVGGYSRAGSVARTLVEQYS